MGQELRNASCKGLHGQQILCISPDEIRRIQVQIAEFSRSILDPGDPATCRGLPQPFFQFLAGLVVQSRELQRPARRLGKTGGTVLGMRSFVSAARIVMKYRPQPIALKSKMNRNGNAIGRAASQCHR